jgi:dynein heavy chain, axonemal
MPEPSAHSLLSIYQVQLGRFFAEHDFNVEIKSHLLALASSCLIMYYRIFTGILPTPNKSHYVFNLRDLARLAKGIMQSSPTTLITKENLVNLFAHECTRVFNDRLVSQQDNELFYSHLSETIFDYFKISIRNPPVRKLGATNQKENEDETAATLTTRTLLYGDFLKSEDRVYQPLTNWKQLLSVLSEYQMRSNMSGHVNKQIAFFREAVEHICRFTAPFLLFCCCCCCCISIINLSNDDMFISSSL